jgi:hypothetical protein
MMSDKKPTSKTKTRQAVKRAATAAISASYTIIKGFVEMKISASKACAPQKSDLKSASS